MCQRSAELSGRVAVSVSGGRKVHLDLVVEEARAPLVVACIGGPEVESCSRDSDGSGSIGFGKCRVIERQGTIVERILGVVDRSVANRDGTENVGLVGESCAVCITRNMFISAYIDPTGG